MKSNTINCLTDLIYQVMSSCIILKQLAICCCTAPPIMTLDIHLLWPSSKKSWEDQRNGLEPWIELPDSVQLMKSAKVHSWFSDMYSIFIYIYLIITLLIDVLFCQLNQWLIDSNVRTDVMWLVHDIKFKFCLFQWNLCIGIYRNLCIGIYSVFISLVYIWDIS